MKLIAYLLYLFAVIDFAGMFFGYDLTGVRWSPVVAGLVGSICLQFAHRKSAGQSHEEVLDYGAPADSIREPASHKTLGNTSLVAMVILTFVTLGVYPSMWFALRMRAINQMRSSRKVTGALAITLILLVVASVGLSLPVSSVFETAEAGAAGSSNASTLFLVLSQILGLSATVIFLVLAFRVRRMLIEHYNDFLRMNVPFSGVATFFLGIFYLQYKMNRLPATDTCTETDKLAEFYQAGQTTRKELENKRAESRGPVGKLRQLQELLDAGLVTQTEFEQKKSELLKAL